MVAQLRVQLEVKSSEATRLSQERDELEMRLCGLEREMFDIESENEAWRDKAKVLKLELDIAKVTIDACSTVTDSRAPTDDHARDPPSIPRLITRLRSTKF